MSNIEEPSRKKSKRDASPESCLTHDMVISVMSRLSRLEYAALSLTSKSYRSLVASPDLYKARSLMNRTETYVYVCLRVPQETTNPRWFILSRRKTSKLIPIPSPPSQPEEASSVMVLDWGIYVLGGWIKGKKKKASSDAWLLDCRTHTWRQLPSMRVARAYAAAGIVDGKIYMLGGCDGDVNKPWGEVFDTKTQTWDFVAPKAQRRICNRYIHDSVVRDHKIYRVDGTDRTFYYSPREHKWGHGNQVQLRDQLRKNRRDWCMADDLIYCLGRNGSLCWCEPDELDWRGPEGIMVIKEVKGLDFLSVSLFFSRLVHFGDQLLDRWEQTVIKEGFQRPFNRCKYGFSYEYEDILPGARLSNSGRNIVLFWDVIKEDRLEIWCTEISLERRQGGEVWGNIEWSDVVMTVDPFVERYKVLHSVSVTL